MEPLSNDVVRWRCGLSLATGLLVAMSGMPASAQWSRAHDSSVVDVLLVGTMTGSGPEPQARTRVVVDAKLQELIDDLLRRSLTFRRQCSA